MIRYFSKESREERRLKADKKWEERVRKAKESKEIRDAKIAAYDAKIAENNKERDAKIAAYDAKIAMHDANIAKIKAHNRRVWEEFKEDFKGKFQEGLDRDREIVRENRERRERERELEYNNSKGMKEDIISKVELLKELEGLRERGVLSEEEFEEKKRLVMGR